MKASEFLSSIDSAIEEFMGHEVVYVTPCRIMGMWVYLNEAQVRWLQVEANRCYSLSESAFNEFVENHEVWCNSSEKGMYKMIFRHDGKFENEFDNGFFNTNAKLAFEIF